VTDFHTVAHHSFLSREFCCQKAQKNAKKSLTDKKMGKNLASYQATQFYMVLPKNWPGSKKIIPAANTVQPDLP